MQAFLSYRVAEAMTARPMTIDRAAPLAEVAGIFEPHDFNSLPVVDSKGRPLGVVTKVDLLKAFVFAPRDAVPAYEASMARPAGEVIRSEPVTVTPTMPLSRVLRIMIHTGLKSFPVVDGDRLVGMITREDVVRALRCAAADGRPARARARTRWGETTEAAPEEQQWSASISVACPWESMTERTSPSVPHAGGMGGSCRASAAGESTIMLPARLSQAPPGSS